MSRSSNSTKLSSKCSTPRSPTPKGASSLMKNSKHGFATALSRPPAPRHWTTFASTSKPCSASSRRCAVKPQGEHDMQLTQIKQLTGTLVLKTGLHVGAGDTEMRIGGTDN